MPDAHAQTCAAGGNRTFEVSLEFIADFDGGTEWMDIRVIEAETGNVVSVRARVTGDENVFSACDWVVHFDNTGNPPRVNLPANTLYVFEFAYVNKFKPHLNETHRLAFSQCSPVDAGFDSNAFHCPNNGELVGVNCGHRRLLPG